MLNKEKYNDMLKNVKKADVILSFNTEIKLSAMIAGITDSEYSHVMMYIGNGFVIESSKGGAKITPLKYYGKEEYNIVILRPFITEQEKQLVVDSALGELGKKYGYLQLMWYLFIRLIGQSENPKWQLDIQPRKMVCSEAIARAYSSLDLEIKKGFRPSGIEPVDFIESPLFEKIYEFKR